MFSPSWNSGQAPSPTSSARACPGRTAVDRSRSVTGTEMKSVRSTITRGACLQVPRRQPTDPSICSWIRRFISTAYSSGSSLVIGSTKPETIIALASASERPRDMR